MVLLAVSCCCFFVLPAWSVRCELKLSCCFSFISLQLKLDLYSWRLARFSCSLHHRMVTSAINLWEVCLFWLYSLMQWLYIMSRHPFQLNIMMISFLMPSSSELFVSWQVSWYGNRKICFEGLRWSICNNRIYSGCDWLCVRRACSILSHWKVIRFDYFLIIIVIVGTDKGCVSRRPCALLR